MDVRKILLQLLCTIFVANSVFAQVGIGTTAPDESSILDISSTSFGLLIPRVSLTSTTDTATIIGAEAVSLLVYNQATVSDVTPGFYYWDGSQWIRISTDNPRDWGLLGNVVDDTVNFFGTTTDQDVVFKTNNVTRMLLNSPEGQLIIGPNVAGSSNNDLLKVTSDVEIGGGAANFDSAAENLLIRARSQSWLLSGHNATSEASSYFFISNESISANTPPFLISNRGWVAIGGDDTSPKDILHVVDDKPSTTVLRIDNSASATNVVHTALRLYDGNVHKASFQHNNFTNVLQIGHEEASGTVELMSGGDNAMTLENDSSVTIETLLNVQPGTAPVAPEEGDIYYDAAAHKLRVYNGTIWEDLN